MTKMTKCRTAGDARQTGTKMSLIDLLSKTDDGFEAVRRAEYERLLALGDAATPADADRLAQFGELIGMDRNAIVADIEFRAAKEKARIELAEAWKKIADREAELQQAEDRDTAARKADQDAFGAVVEVAVVSIARGPTADPLRRDYLRSRGWAELADGRWRRGRDGGVAVLGPAVDIELRCEAGRFTAAARGRLQRAAAEAVRQGARPVAAAAAV
jgi:hypothetical protein